MAHHNHHHHHHTNVSMEDDFISELTHQMSHFMLQQDQDQEHDNNNNNNNNSFHFSSNSELLWDTTSSPDSTLWSQVSYNQGSSEGSSQEPSPPPTPCNWKTTTNFDHALNVFDNNAQKVALKSLSEETAISSHKKLIQEQIKAIKIKKQHQHDPSPKQESEKKGSNGRNWVRPLQTGGGGGSAMRAVFIGESGSRNGTGVFLPRGGTVVAPSELTKKKQGKGCSTVLIPARVVQALQLHFDKTASMSGGPKVVDFPPLRDLVLSNREGMYSLENQQSTKSPTDVHSDMILPNEWTY